MNRLSSRKPLWGLGAALLFAIAAPMAYANPIDITFTQQSARKGTLRVKSA